MIHRSAITTDKFENLKKPRCNIMSTTHSRSSTPLENLKTFVSPQFNSPFPPLLIATMHFHLPHVHVKSFADVVEQVRDAIRHYKHEKESEAHQVWCRYTFKWDTWCILSPQIFRNASISHQPKGGLPATINPVCILSYTYRTPTSI